ncbi:MAG: HrgA protein [Candidatus Dadabacteria bacterium]|nr:HrgA protein [Candidatus Dadabacteria bacterium]
MGLKLTKKVVDFLRNNTEQRFTARQIAQWILNEFPIECQEKKIRSKSIETDVELLQQIVAEIGRDRPRFQRRNPEIKTTEEKPRRYYWTIKSDQPQAIEEDESLDTTKDYATGSSSLNEYNLYPILSKYLWSELRIYSKRIDEKKASNKRGLRGNKWLYPDLVGMEDLTTDWHREIKDAVKEYASQKTKLWSFEVKTSLNRSNVREAFFQAVSNSSWANFGYLAAAEIEGNNTMKELRMLFSLHGIGLIQIDPEAPTKSQILIPAREKPEVDWATCNRLTLENKDFLQFVKLVRQFHQTDDPRPKDWDIPKNPSS